MKLRHTAAWAGFTAVALVTASGCGAEPVKHAAEAVDDTGTIMAALARATDRTEQLGSAEVSMTTDLGNGHPVPMAGTYSWGDGFAYDVEMDTKATQLQDVQDAPTIRMLFVDGDYYYDVDPQPSGPLKGKEWMKLDGSVVFGEKGAQAFGGNTSGGSPSATMRSLKYAQDVEDLGEQTLSGQRTTHYRAVIDTSRLGKLKDVYGDEDNLFNSVTGGGSSIDMDVWVGAKDLPVRIKQKIGKMTVTMDFRKFGATADVKAPPAAQVADVSALIRQNTQKQG